MVVGPSVPHQIKKKKKKKKWDFLKHYLLYYPKLQICRKSEIIGHYKLFEMKYCTNKRKTVEIKHL